MKRGYTYHSFRNPWQKILSLFCFQREAHFNIQEVVLQFQIIPRFRYASIFRMDTLGIPPSSSGAETAPSKPSRPTRLPPKVHPDGPDSGPHQKNSRIRIPNYPFACHSNSHHLNPHPDKLLSWWWLFEWQAKG